MVIGHAEFLDSIRPSIRIVVVDAGGWGVGICDRS